HPRCHERPRQERRLRGGHGAGELPVRARGLGRRAGRGPGRERHRGRVRGGHLRPRLLRLVHPLTTPIRTPSARSADAPPESAPASELRDLAPEHQGLALLGAQAMELVKVGHELYSVFVRTLYYCVYGRREKGAVVERMYEIGNRSVFFLTVVMGFI